MKLVANLELDSQGGVSYKFLAIVGLLHCVIKHLMIEKKNK